MSLQKGSLCKIIISVIFGAVCCQQNTLDHTSRQGDTKNCFGGPAYVYMFAGPLGKSVM